MDKIEGLDPEIEWMVNLLREEGIETIYSCQGGEGHLEDSPMIQFEGAIGDQWHALAVCDHWGLPLLQIKQSWSIYDGQPHGPKWELWFYDTKSRS